MGFFNNIKNMFKQTAQMPGQALKMQDEAMKMVQQNQAYQQQLQQDLKAGGAVMNEADPIWNRIEGATLDQYSHFAYWSEKNQVTDPEKIKQYLSNFPGINADAWETIFNGWKERIASHENVKTRFEMLLENAKEQEKKQG